MPPKSNTLNLNRESDTVDRRGVRGPARDRVATRRQRLRHAAAHFAEAEHGDLNIFGALQRVLRPTLRTLLAGIREEAALQVEHGPERGLGHRRTHRRIDHARERHGRGHGRVGEQRVDAGPQRLHERQ